MQEKADQERFKNYLRKIGSGEQTSRSMTRNESADALNLILTGIPSPAQIGAFLIAHRIRRPEPQELAGMVDTYLELGPKLYSANQQQRPICFGMPFDGRNRTAPIYPLTTLILISAGQPVVLQGGAKMPVKYGTTTKELYSSLGLDLEGLSLEEINNGFIETGLGFIYQPNHFPLAEKLISYREEIGKRPPLASMELLWTAHQGEHLHVSGYVHNPTEERHWQTLKLLKEFNSITVKGLEGSTDLPISKKSLIGKITKDGNERININPRNYNYFGKDITLECLQEWKRQAFEALENKGPLKKSLLWNAGVYLWLAGSAENIEEGLFKAESLIQSGLVKSTLKKLIDWRKQLIKY
tara:strand:+ start:91926 stop:92990 length:1065 start_codon:yes stop_codon:yes gene_type:complete